MVNTLPSETKRPRPALGGRHATGRARPAPRDEHVLAEPDRGRAVPADARRGRPVEHPRDHHRPAALERARGREDDAGGVPRRRFAARCRRGAARLRDRAAGRHDHQRGVRDDLGPHGTRPGRRGPVRRRADGTARRIGGGGVPGRRRGDDPARPGGGRATRPDRRRPRHARQHLTGPDRAGDGHAAVADEPARGLPRAGAPDRRADRADGPRRDRTGPGDREAAARAEHPRPGHRRWSRCGRSSRPPERSRRSRASSPPASARASRTRTSRTWAWRSSRSRTATWSRPVTARVDWPTSPGRCASSATRARRRRTGPSPRPSRGPTRAPSSCSTSATTSAQARPATRPSCSRRSSATASRRSSSACSTRRPSA